MRHNFTVRVSDEEAEWLKQEAERQGRSVANLIRLLILRYREGVDGVAGSAPGKGVERG